MTEIAGQISQRLQMRGAWFFQLKRNDEGEYRLLEAATRVAGTMCVERAAGVNLPLLTVFDAMGYDVSVEKQLDTVEVDRALGNVYRLPISYDEVYVDFDDTITVHGKINTVMMQFLYQCVNKEIPIHLITKHAADIRESLRKYKIAEELFASITHIDPEKEPRFSCGCSLHPKRSLNLASAILSLRSPLRSLLPSAWRLRNCSRQ